MDIKKIDANLLKNMIEYGSKNLEIHKNFVNDLNVFPVPDGDTGTNMSLTMQSSVSEINKSEINTLYDVAKNSSSGALIGARGNSGVILSQLLRGFARGCKEKNELDVYGLAFALKEASDMAYKAVMKPTEGTILTVAREMAEFAMEEYIHYEYINNFAEEIIRHGKISLKNTPELLPVLKEANVVDAGGQGLMMLLEGAYKCMMNIQLDEEIEFNIASIDNFIDDGQLSLEDITYGYCTEFLIKNSDFELDPFKEFLLSKGDSLVLLQDEGLTKVHVHTDEPGNVLQKALGYGQLTKMKIENMREQFETVHLDEIKEKIEYGFIAVSPGPGLTQLLIDLGVNYVITGGQTMNPSTQDFIDSIHKLNAKNVILFPNNSNIIMAANQAAELENKEDQLIYVIPTKTVPQSITAMLNFNPEISIEDNFTEMKESINDVKTGQITYAVRDTVINGKNIKKNDIIGIFNGDIAVSGNNINEVAQNLIDMMTDEEDELISIYYGEDVEENTVEKFVETLEEKYEDYDIETNEGGQPLYYYIISVE
jgi:DAK2 domain fusion protein YloV